MQKTARRYTPCSSKNWHFPAGFFDMTLLLRTESLTDENKHDLYSIYLVSNSNFIPNLIKFQLLIMSEIATQIALFYPSIAKICVKSKFQSFFYVHFFHGNYKIVFPKR